MRERKRGRKELRRSGSNMDLISFHVLEVIIGIALKILMFVGLCLFNFNTISIQDHMRLQLIFEYCLFKVGI